MMTEPIITCINEFYKSKLSILSLYDYISKAKTQGCSTLSKKTIVKSINAENFDFVIKLLDKLNSSIDILAYIIIQSRKYYGHSKSNKS